MKACLENENKETLKFKNEWVWVLQGHSNSDSTLQINRSSYDHNWIDLIMPIRVIDVCHISLSLRSKKQNTKPEIINQSLRGDNSPTL